MQIKKGNSRVVILVPFLGIAIKIPRIRLVLAVKDLYGCVQKSQVRQRLKFSWNVPVEYDLGFKGPLFRGLVVNWCEYQFYRQTHHPFVQPTYASFFGIFNIQQYGEPCTLEAGNLLERLCMLTNGEAYTDAHHFANPQNFCFYNGKLRILDYGGLVCQGIIARHGLRIFEQFNPEYSCQAEFGKKPQAVQKSEIN